MSYRDAKIIVAILSHIKDPVMIEYGSGWSTVHFQHFAKRLITVETDREWLTTISPFLRPNVMKLHCEDTSRTLYTEIPFYEERSGVDVVFLDGKHRDYIAGYLLEKNFAKFVLLHDSRRGSKNMEQWPFCAKIGDDLAIASMTRPDWLFDDEYEVRPMSELSHPWDKSHKGDPAFSDRPLLDMQW